MIIDCDLLSSTGSKPDEITSPKQWAIQQVQCANYACQSVFGEVSKTTGQLHVTPQR